MVENKKYLTQAINDEILGKLSLKNRYSIINNNLGAILNSKERNFFQKVQAFCLKFEEENKLTHGPEEDIYDWIPAFGKEGYICRAEPFAAIDQNYEEYGLTAEFMRYLAIDLFDTQYAMGSGATVLAVNPVREHHDNVPVRLECLKEMITGAAPGCILITEPERGSDAVHQLTLCEEQPDGSFILNGDKIFNTNAPKAKWAVCYATTEKNNGNTMAQFLINTSWDGWNCERVYIPWVPKLFLGKEKLVNLRVPPEYILGGVGKGREHLFEGLVPERIGIAMGGVSQSWNAVVHALIYSNLRKQFNQTILQFQGVGFLLADLWAKTSNVSLALLKFCEGYDEKMERYNNEIPKHINQSMVGTASQLKYHATHLTMEVCYEAANLMGGAGLCDNTLMHDLVNISRIQEIVGGSRQIQQHIIAMALNGLYKASQI